MYTPCPRAQSQSSKIQSLSPSPPLDTYLRSWACPVPRVNAILAFWEHQPRSWTQSPQTLFLGPGLHHTHAPVPACLSMCGADWGQCPGPNSNCPGPAWGLESALSSSLLSAFLDLHVSAHPRRPVRNHHSPSPNPAPDSVGSGREDWLGSLTDVSLNTGSSWCDPGHQASWQVSRVDSMESHP